MNNLTILKRTPKVTSLPHFISQPLSPHPTLSYAISPAPLAWVATLLIFPPADRPVPCLIPWRSNTNRVSLSLSARPPQTKYEN